MVEPLIWIARVGKRGFLVTWKDAALVMHSEHCSNRNALRDVVFFKAAPMIRGDLPEISDEIELRPTSPN